MYVMRHLRSTVAGLALAAALGYAGTAQAAFVRNSLGGATFTPNVGSVDLSTSFYSNHPNGAGGDIAAVTGSPAQSPANITALVNNRLATIGEGPLTLSTSTVTVTGGGTRSGTVSGGSFLYAAIHAGNNEYLIEFSRLATSFSFSGLAAGFSNVRVF